MLPYLAYGRIAVPVRWCSRSGAASCSFIIYLGHQEAAAAGGRSVADLAPPSVVRQAGPAAASGASVTLRPRH